MSAGIGFITSMVLARRLGVEDFGTYSLAMALMIVISGIAGGSIDQALVKFSSLYLDKEREKAELVFKLSFNIKLITAVVLLFVCYLLRAPLSRIIFKGPGFENLVSLAFLGAIGITLFGYVLAYLQSHQTFVKYVVLDTLNSVAKLSLVGFLIFANILTPASSISIYVIVPFLTFILGMMLIPKTFLRVKGSQKSLLPELVHFSKWIVLSYVIFAFSRRMDIFLLSYFKGGETVGIYSVALIIASGMDLIALSLFVVIFPKLSRYTKKEEYVQFIKKFLLGAIPLYIFTCIFFMWVSRPLVETFYTAAYMDSARVIEILVPGYAVYFIAFPLSAITLSMNRPEVLVVFDLVVLLLMFVFGIILIPLYGAIGAAVATLISNSAFILLLSGWLFKELRTVPSCDTALLPGGSAG